MGLRCGGQGRLLGALGVGGRRHRPSSNEECDDGDSGELGVVMSAATVCE